MGKTTRSLRIALTAGDPFGVGPELCVAAWREREGDDRVALTIYGDPRLLPGVPAEGVLPSGQVTGVIEDQPTCAELVTRMMNEAEQALARLNGAASATTAKP